MTKDIEKSIQEKMERASQLKHEFATLKRDEQIQVFLTEFCRILWFLNTFKSDG